MNDVPARPPHYSLSVDKIVANSLLPHVLTWLKSNGDDHIEEEHDDILEQLTESLFMHDDGYSVSKHLDEKCMWSVDSELVGILDDVGHLRYHAHESLVEGWVVQHHILPEYSVGQRVTFKKQRYEKEAVEGVITAVREKTATYLIFSEELGHVSSGTGTYGVHLAYEDVKEVTRDTIPSTMVFDNEHS